MNHRTHRSPISIRQILAIFVMVVLASVQPAAASSMVNVLCTVAGWMVGDIGRGIATIAVITIGISACLGKASWGMAILVAIGISVIFNAPYLVEIAGGVACAV